MRVHLFRAPKVLSILLLATFLASSCESLILACNYIESDFWISSDVYSCNGVLLTVGDTVNVTVVNQDHLEGKTHNDVKGLSIVQQNDVIRKFPQNIQTFFPNLEVIRIMQSTIAEVTDKDFSVFPALRELDLRMNKIKIIKRNSFKQNPQLKAICFNDNPIKHIAHYVFDDLSNLQWLQFSNALCVDGEINNNTNVVPLSFKIFQQCPPTSTMIGEEILPELVDQINDLKKELDHIRDRLGEQTTEAATTESETSEAATTESESMRGVFKEIEVR